MTTASMKAANGQQDLSKRGIGSRKRKHEIPISLDRLWPHGSDDCLDNLFLRKVEFTTFEMEDLLRSSCLDFIVLLSCTMTTSSSDSSELLHIESAKEGTGSVRGTTRRFNSSAVDIISFAFKSTDGADVSVQEDT